MTLRVSEYKGNLQVQDCYQAFIYVDINKCHCFFRLLYYYTSLFSACKVQDFGLSSRSLVPLKGGRKVCTLWKNIQVYYYKTAHFTEQDCITKGLQVSKWRAMKISKAVMDHIDSN